MFTCTLLGGLGNQLFQIITTMSLSIDKGDDFCFIISKPPLGIPKRSDYWFTFLRNLHQFYKKESPSSIIIKEISFNYHPFEKNFDKNKLYSLFGYFQSYKYFDHNKEKIFELLNLKNIKSNISTKINLDFSNTISIHFRIGDYKLKQGAHPVLPVQYYINSLGFIQDNIDNFKNKKILYVFNEEDQEDINKNINLLKQHFTNEFIPIDNKLLDWQQLIVMSLCKHNVIANSSFSWWGSYFNQHDQPIICYPSVWFGPNLNHDTTDLCLNEWNRIEII